MTYQEFDNKFKKQIEKLSRKRKIDFALNICKKLFFNYQTFFEENGWGNPDIILNGINLIEHSGSQLPDKNLIKTTIKKIENITPDTEDFSNASYALNACCAVLSTLDFILEDKFEKIYDVGRCLYDTIDARVQDNMDLTEKEIDEHSMIIETRRHLLEASR